MRWGGKGEGEGRERGIRSVRRGGPGSVRGEGKDR